MDFNFVVGSSIELFVRVDETNTAETLGSGTLPVFGTPAMIALMEKTAVACVSAQMPQGFSSVGTKIDVSHLSASPIGAEIRCEAVLTEVDRRRLVFSCKAYDDAGLIGEGTQERFVVENSKFLAKTEAKICK